MNEPAKLLTEFELDQRMLNASMTPPADFERNVMRRIVVTKAMVPVPRSPRHRSLKPLHWIVGTLGGAFALSELLAFVFGFWTVSTAF
jgi:hypothetical protein